MIIFLHSIWTLLRKESCHVIELVQAARGEEMSGRKNAHCRHSPHQSQVSCSPSSVTSCDVFEFCNNTWLTADGVNVREKNTHYRHPSILFETSFLFTPIHPTIFICSCADNGDFDNIYHYCYYKWILIFKKVNQSPIYLYTIFSRHIIAVLLRKYM